MNSRMIEYSLTAHAALATEPRPIVRSAPDVGKSLAMMISPLFAPPPPAGAWLQAAATRAPARIAAAENQRLCIASSQWDFVVRAAPPFPIRVSRPILMVEGRRRPSRRQLQ